MRNVNVDMDKIMECWLSKIPNRTPDFENEAHIDHLKYALLELEYPVEFVENFILEMKQEHLGR